jgi:hypothetical protein
LQSLGSALTVVALDENLEGQLKALWVARRELL